MRPQSPRSSFFNALTDVPITTRKTRVEVANSGKTVMFNESIRAFPKKSENPVFDHSNYRLFERIPAVPSTSNNQGSTVPYFFSKIRKDVAKFIICCSCDWRFNG